MHLLPIHLSCRVHQTVIRWSFTAVCDVILQHSSWEFVIWMCQLAVPCANGGTVWLVWVCQLGDMQENHFITITVILHVCRDFWPSLWFYATSMIIGGIYRKLAGCLCVNVATLFSFAGSGPVCTWHDLFIWQTFIIFAAHWSFRYGWSSMAWLFYTSFTVCICGPAKQWLWR